MFQNRFVMANQALKHQSGWYKMKYRGDIRTRAALKGREFWRDFFSNQHKSVCQNFQRKQSLHKFKHIIDIQRMELIMTLSILL